MRTFTVALVVIAVACSAVAAERTAVDVLGDIYRTCTSAPSISACAKPKALSWLSNVANEDVIQITQDLKIVRVKDEVLNGERNFATKEERVAERIMSFLESHSLKMDVPQMFQTQEARSFLPEGQDFGDGIEIPLVAGQVEEGESKRFFLSQEWTFNHGSLPYLGRSIVKKVIIPFLVGLKFKASVLVPLMMALIALKTWKALTLGLLSLVLAGSIAIFKLVKPKVVNYEVVHFPHAHPHHIDHHHVDHHAHHLHHGWARQDDAQNLAYNAFA